MPASSVTLPCRLPGKHPAAAAERCCGELSVPPAASCSGLPAPPKTPSGPAWYPRRGAAPPITNTENPMGEKILLAHGSGSRLSHYLIEKILAPPLSNPILALMDDS